MALDMYPLAWGRTQTKGFKVIWRRLHIFVFIPGVSKKGFGVTIRIRTSERHWIHYQLVLFERHRGGGAWRQEQKYNTKRYIKGQRRSPGRNGPFIVRPTLTIFEFTKWYTKGDNKTRVGLKSYIRLKASLGGKQI